MKGRQREVWRGVGVYYMRVLAAAAAAQGGQSNDAAYEDSIPVC